MDFFEAQDIARKNTGKLMVLFALAVLALVGITMLLAMAVLAVGAELNDMEALQGMPAPLSERFANAFTWELLFLVASVVLGVVVLGTIYKLTVLSGGGRVVAESLGGRLVPQGSHDKDERRLLNVVAEMAIASGTPVPPVYLLANELSINAFAAGLTPSDAVIGVTKGAVQQLTREQLQGVIAHEFSHILNGDMRLNMRLTGIVHGIMVIGLIGYGIIRWVGYGGTRRDARAALAALSIGAGLAVIGWGGTVFGNLIKSAVSRQREYLADASAVQFSRNPRGIAGALKRIGGFRWHAVLKSPRAPEMSHAFFADSMGFWLSGLLGTHPPLEKRIRRIDPHWDGKFDVGEKEHEKRRAERREKRKIAAGQAVAAVTTAAVLDVVGYASRAGNPTGEDVSRAHELLERIPQPVRNAVSEPYGARAVIYAMLLDADDAIREEQLEHLNAHGDLNIGGLTRQLSQAVAALERTQRLPVIDLALPALHQLSNAQYQSFRRNLTVLIGMDAHITLFEWCLQRTVTHNLERRFTRKRVMKDDRTPIYDLKQECAVLLSALAYGDTRPESGGLAAFEAAMPYLQLPGVMLLPKEQATLGRLNTAVDRLSRLKPLHKRRLLRACVATIHADGKVSPEQAELTRVVADNLGCPLGVGP